MTYTVGYMIGSLSFNQSDPRSRIGPTRASGVEHGRDSDQGSAALQPGP